jgi:2-amino-4-hydroxy-6-hydroxymethyldihydropteridine diphosphokinase
MSLLAETNFWQSDLSGYDLLLGRKWYDAFYNTITTSLGYSKESDECSRDELSVLLKERRVKSFDVAYEALTSKFKRKNCLVFGAGPSLHEDIMNLYPVARKSKNLVIAADGATDDLIEGNIVPQISVSDLDGSSEQGLLSQSENRILFVHAHGDNIDALGKLVPKLGKNILGTTQVSSIENVRNLGGFMDGDRSCYLASSFDPEIVVLAGMDFEMGGQEKLAESQEENQSATWDKKKKKFDFGRRSLEFLIETKPEIRFVKSTSHGQAIRGAEKIEITKIIEALS